ncbi:peptidoglycan-binding domain-containing protein [Streptomyces sp. NPDC089919]|uniref:peptidoglycan-binding domain-containing protein n=1 Tax=Streptomyces sp. NPDC089919 TaxID=3155188 RepID=UPI0034469A95
MLSGGGEEERPAGLSGATPLTSATGRAPGPTGTPTPDASVGGSTTGPPAPDGTLVTDLTTPTAPVVRSPSPGPSRTVSPSRTPGPPPPPSPLPPAPRGATLRPGDTGPEVKALKQRLHQIDMFDGDMQAQYGHALESAVADYQKRQHITSDPTGVYGPATRRALEAQTSV